MRVSNRKMQINLSVMKELGPRNISNFSVVSSDDLLTCAVRIVQYSPNSRLMPELKGLLVQSKTKTEATVLCGFIGELLVFLPRGDDK